MQRRSKLLNLDAQPVRSGAGVAGIDQPTVKLEIVGDDEMAHAEQAARTSLTLGPHLG